MKGKVYLVGAGPGDPELLTLKALKVLKHADVVLHDDLIGPEILEYVPRAAQLRNVGKRCGRKRISQEEINCLLVTFASFGLQVVRLKGGDPFIFGRGGEEVEVLRRAKIDFEIVPGVTAALGAAAAAQIPLTHRNMSSAVVLLTAHHADGSDGKTAGSSARAPQSQPNGNEWRRLVSTGATLVIYMPGHDSAGTAHKLLDAGLKGTTACAIVSQATSRAQRVHRTTIANLLTTPQLPAPTLLIIGEVVRLAANDGDLQEEFEPFIHQAQSEEAVPLHASSEVFNQDQSL